MATRTVSSAYEELSSGVENLSEKYGQVNELLNELSEQVDDDFDMLSDAIFELRNRCDEGAETFNHFAQATSKEFTYAVWFAVATAIWGVIMTVVMILGLNGQLPVQEEEVIEAPVEVVYIEQEPVIIQEPVSYYSYIDMTQEEVDLLAKVLYLEANNQSLTGQRAVVEVIFNRVRHEEFPDTVADVLYQRGQFSTIKSLDKAKPNEVQYDVIQTVLDESIPILTPDTVYFATSKASGTFYERIGDHYFCRG